jgi:hypothetical protein
MDCAFDRKKLQEEIDVKKQANNCPEILLVDLPLVTFGSKH